MESFKSKETFSVKTISQFPAVLVTFNEEVYNEKLQFLCSETCMTKNEFRVII